MKNREYYERLADLYKLKGVENKNNREIQDEVNEIVEERTQMIYKHHLEAS